MTARAEAILTAIETAITGLTTTGSNVERGKVYGYQAAELPALSLYMGEDTPAAEYQTGLVDWELQIRIESMVSIDAADNASLTDSTIETQLNLIRSEVHAAVMADHTLGLSYVIDIIPGTASAPILSGEGAEPTGSQAIEYTIHYRTSRADIGA